MQLSYKPFTLQFKSPFGVSSNMRSFTETIFVSIAEDEVIGYGEACLPPYLGENAKDTIAFLEKAKSVISKYSTNDSLVDILKEINLISQNNNAAKASIDIALHDLFSKKENKNFCDWKGMELPNGISTSVTIGISDESSIIEKINEANHFSVLKIKGGTKDDKELISFIRKHTDKPIYLDLNQGWRNKEYAADILDWLSDKNITLVEQPLPKEMHKEMKWLTVRSSIATIADESIKTLSDLENMEGAFHGINIKLMKSSGINEALKMISYCKQNNIKVMLGCMAESSCGTTAMAHLTSLADYVDLDAPQLYRNDPFIGLQYKGGKIYLNRDSGFGTTPIDHLF